MRTSAFLAPLVAAALAAPAASQPGTAVPLGQFRAVEVDGGGHVTVCHGDARSLVVREGSLDISRVELVGERLVIEGCPGRCPRGYRLELELTTPDLISLAVQNGGVLQTSGAFPAQPSVAAAVANGGILDIRSLPAARVAAAVAQGGRIFTRPSDTLTASVVNGGIVTYWGEARVQRSILHGGVVTRGDAADWGRSVAEMDPQPIAPLPVPPVPPVLGKPMPSVN